MTKHTAAKLIRDRIAPLLPPEEIRVASKEERFPLLESKLAEELDELENSDFGDVEEYADVIEVLLTLARERGIPASEINTAMTAKRRIKGGITSFYVWTPRPKDPSCGGGHQT